MPNRLRAALPLLLGLCGPLTHAAPDVAGRWEGSAEVPGTAQRLVVDLARGPSGWTGSVILPGRDVKGAPLKDLAVGEGQVKASLSAAFAQPPEPAPELVLQARPDGTLAGELRMAGLSAPVTLRRAGDAQVDLPAPATAVSPQLIGTWSGGYELGGAPRQVTLKVANGPQGLGGGEIVVVGKRTTTLPLDRVVQGREFVSFESTAMGYRIEGRWATPDGSIHGQMVQGPYEAPIVLRRVGGAS